MGIYESSIHLNNPSTITPSPNHYDSFESSKILPNYNNLSKNLKEILSANIDKKNTRKLNITNSNINYLIKQTNSKCNNSKKNRMNEQLNKISFVKGINTSKTVDKKQLKNNLDTTKNNSKNNNSNNKRKKSNDNSYENKKISYIREDSKKKLGTTEKSKNININNINIHNKNNKDLKPFYYKPKSIFTKQSYYKSHNNTSYNQAKTKINKNIRLKNLDVTKSKDKILTKNGSFKNLNNLVGTDIHRSFNNISRITSNDKLNIINNFYTNKKVNYKLEQIIDVHNYYNDFNNRPIYIIDDITNFNQNVKDNTNYSTEKEYNDIIRNNKEENDINKIYIKLLKLKERKWQEDLNNISKILSTIRNSKTKNQEINLNYIFHKILWLFDHFNWIINSIGFIFHSIFYENKEENINNYSINTLNFPKNDSIFWFKGFKWKGLYIRVDKDINCINNIKKEIKALNYFFLDFIHVIWNNELIQDLNVNDKKIILSNNIIFPLIGYCQINSFILIVSSIIKPESNISDLDIFTQNSNGKVELYSRINLLDNNNIIGNKNKYSSKHPNKYNNYRDNRIKNNNEFNFNSININEFNKKQLLINKLNHSIDYSTSYRKNENTSFNKITEIKIQNQEPNDNNTNLTGLTFFGDDYYINDLLNSKLCSQLNKSNLIPIKNGKFILIDLAKYLPNLFENKFNQDIKKINFYATVNNEKKFITLNYNSSLFINIKHILDHKNNYKKNLQYYDTLTPKLVFEKIYKLSLSPNLKLKNVIIGNMIFRILYLNAIKNKKNSKKNFVDFLFNYNNDNKKENNEMKLDFSHINLINKNENENYFISVQEPYVIIYDIIEPIKLDYSLIKSTKIKDNQNEIIYDSFYIRTNYMDYFMSWCDMFNRNSFNIKRYCDLKYYMKKFGINQNLLFFSLFKINNNEISDIIKIHLLIKCFKFICYNKDNDTLINKFRKDLKYRDLNLFDNLKSKILFYIKSVIYPNEILPSYQKLFKSIYEQLSFFSNILFFKFKLIDDYLSLGILNVDKHTLNQKQDFYSFFNIKSSQEFLKHCILIARKKPFLFISELEYKLNFLVHPFIKFKSSISIESMSHQLDISHLELNNIIIKSFIDSNEISGLILTKLISKYKEKEKKVFIKNNKNDLYKKSNDNKNNNKIYELGGENVDLKINNVIYFSNPNRKLAASNKKVNIMNTQNNINKNNLFNENNNDSEFKIKTEFTEGNNNININSNNFIIRNINDNNNNNNIYENNDVFSKMSSDKTMEETDTSNQKIILDKNKNKIKNNNLSKIDTINFKEINENIIFIVPANCHKILFNYEKNYIPKKSKNLYPNLNQYYSINNIQIIKDWISANDTIFKTLTNSNNYNCENVLIKSYIFAFLYIYYIEKNPKDFLRINNKLVSLLNNNIQFNLSLNEIAIINLIQALSNNDYIQNEEYFSKCVMLILINYGDPRGRYNDSHGFLQFPLWEIARKTYKLEEAIINENFKEMYQALDFFEKTKGFYDVTQKNNSDMFNYNFVDNIINNIEKIKIMNLKGGDNLLKKTEKNKDNKNNDALNDTESIFSMINNIEENPNDININKELTDLDISLSKSYFEKNYVEKLCITHYIFPSISCKISNVGRVFYRKEFIIYIIKEILSLYLSRGIIYSKKYLDKNISDELIIIRDNNINKSKSSINQEKTRDNSKNSKYNETPIKIKNINNLNLEKKIPNSSLRTNPYLKIDKKYNNRNIQNYYPMNNIFGTAKSSKSYNNCMNKSNIIKNNSKKSNNNNLKNSNPARKTLSNDKKLINNTETSTNKNNQNINNNTKSKKIFSHFLYIELYQKLSYKKNLPSGIIISCGNNKHNETSHDRYEKLTLPRVIFKLKNEMIDKIYSGWEHNIVLNNKGEIFSFGHNQYYQCGLPNIEKNSSISENINDPTNISVLNNNLKAIKVSCGNENTLIISEDKNVYGFGNNEGGLLGFQDNAMKTYKPIKINFSYQINNNKIENYDGKILDISCGTIHNLALTEDGKVFSWGSLQGGQLGLPSDFLINYSKNSKINSEQNFYISNPTPIPYFLNNNIKISQISCGEAHSLALSNKGKAYSWGFGSNGQLGLGFCEDCFEPGEGLVKSRIFEPQLIHTFKDYNSAYKGVNINYATMKIKEIKCGKTFSMFINTNNDLFACGINDLRQLGFKDLEKKDKINNFRLQCDDYIYPSLLNCFNHRKVEKISCGEGHCLAVIKYINSNIQSIWSWGNNKYGQIGHGLMVKISLPKEVEYLSEYNMNYFSDVSCGGFHSLILLKSKNNLDWIEKDYEDYILGIFNEIGDL